MNVLTHISLNFQQPNYLTVYAAQNDRLSRYINAQLLDGSAPWTLPTGGLMTIRYRKPDGTSGFYDTLEDGSPAYNVETDGSITFGLAEQALTVPGAVPVELNFYNAAGSKLSTLTFIVAVKPSAYSDEDIASSDYYNILTAKMQQLAELSDQAEGDYQDYLSALSAFVGAPRTAPTAADMLDTNLVYVYTGSETGYTYGDWYYYNGREWVSGGVYNSAAISLDATLTNADKPAQAKAAGDLVLVQDTQPTAPVNKLWFPLMDPEDEQVPTWDEFVDLKSAFALDYTDAGLWEFGGISSSAGTDSVSTTRLRTAVFPWSVYAVSCNNGYKFMVFCYEGETYKGTWNGSIVQKSATWHTSTVNLKDIGNYNFRFVFAKSDDSTVAVADAINCVFSGYVDKTLSHKGKPADAFATNEAIQKAENKIIEPEKTFVSVGAETAPNATLKSGFYCTRATARKMEIKTSASYNTFYLELLNDAEFYCESGTSIFRICTIKQGVESESGGAISITGQDCTEYNSGSFPNSTNKINLVKGDYIAVSATTSNNLSIMMSFDRFSDTIILTNRQIEQVKNATISALGTSVKSPACLYNSGTLMVYVPTGNGYVRYDFKHDVDQSINADIWRVDNAYHTDDDFANASRLTTSGEWECALHLSGRDDFSGGIAHGDEIVQEITFILDGNAVDVSDISEMTSFSILRIVETSKLYDPADHTTQICVHGSEHIFTKDGLTINQNIIWSGTFEATTCYLAMFPPKKNGDDAVYMDTNYDVIALPASNYRNVYPGAKSVGIFSETAKFCGTFEVPKYVDESGGNVLWILDNGGSNYHKMYFVVTTGKTVSNGEMWRTQTKYKLDVGT